MMRRQLIDHTIVCGYGTCGAVVVSDFLTVAPPAGTLVVIDADQDRALLAARLGVLTLVGDATQLKTLRLAHVGAARSVVVCAEEDAATLRIVRRHIVSAADRIAP